MSVIIAGTKNFDSDRSVFTAAYYICLAHSVILSSLWARQNVRKLSRELVQDSTNQATIHKCQGNCVWFFSTSVYVVCNSICVFAHTHQLHHERIFYKRNALTPSTVSYSLTNCFERELRRMCIQYAHAMDKNYPSVWLVEKQEQSWPKMLDFVSQQLQKNKIHSNTAVHSPLAHFVRSLIHATLSLA